MPPKQTQTQQSKPSKGSKISNTEWGLVIGALMWVDLIQFFLDGFAIGIIANRFIDIVVGMSLAFYFWIRKVKMDQKKVLTLIGSFIGEEIPGLDALPLWSADGIVTMMWDKADKNLPNLPI
jgi:hypothetical protein